MDDSERREKIKARAIELIGEGVDPVQAGLQAEAENRAPPQTLLKIEVELTARDMMFVREVCKNDDQIRTLIRYLIAGARRDWRMNPANFQEPVKGEARTIPAHLMPQFTGKG